MRWNSTERRSSHPSGLVRAEQRYARGCQNRYGRNSPGNRAHHPDRAPRQNQPGTCSAAKVAFRSCSDHVPMSEGSLQRLRVFLVLGRVSNLPTVWSNCTAAWLIAGGGSVPRLVFAAMGASILYIGGMYLNDAFDADFDRRHRATRPIPLGLVDEQTVWLLGSALTLAGSLVLWVFAGASALITLLLAGAVVLYDALHKHVSFSPLLMALCRFLLFLAAAQTGIEGINGLVIWSAIALAGWIVGLSYLARRESLISAPLDAWPLLALGIPMVLAAFANQGSHRAKALALGTVVVVWAWRCIRLTFGKVPRNVGATVSGLLAAICLVDLLAAAPNGAWTLFFVGCFGSCLLFQRHVPAT